MMSILDALSSGERSLLVEVLSAGAPDLLVDIQNGIVSPGMRERIVDVLEEKQVGELLRTAGSAPAADAIERLLRRLDEVYPREPEALVHHGRSKPGTRVPRGMERYREKNPEYRMPQIWDVTRGQWVPARSRATWAAPAYALRPTVSNVFRLDLGYQPEASVAPLLASSKYQVILPGGVEADYFTDDTGKVCYVETEYGTPQRPNTVLSAALPRVVYLVHPAGDAAMPSHVIFTDDRARLVEVKPTRLSVSGAPGQDSFPPAALFGGIPCAVSPHTILAHLDAAETDRLAVLAARLVDAVFARERPQLTLQAFYDGDASVPSRIQVRCTMAEQTFMEQFSSR